MEKSEKGKRREMRRAGLLPRVRHPNTLELAREVVGGRLDPADLRGRVLGRTFRRTMGYVRAMLRDPERWDMGRAPGEP